MDGRHAGPNLGSPTSPDDILLSSWAACRDAVKITSLSRVAHSSKRLTAAAANVVVFPVPGPPSTTRTP